MANRVVWFWWILVLWEINVCVESWWDVIVVVWFVRFGSYRRSCRFKPFDRLFCDGSRRLESSGIFLFFFRGSWWRGVSSMRLGLCVGVRLCIEGVIILLCRRNGRGRCSSRFWVVRCTWGRFIVRWGVCRDIIRRGRDSCWCMLYAFDNHWDVIILNWGYLETRYLKKSRWYFVRWCLIINWYFFVWRVI